MNECTICHAKEGAEHERTCTARFPVGCKVRLVEGGPVMTVDVLRDSKGDVIELGPGWDHVTYCRWYEGGQAQGYGFKSYRLERVSMAEISAEQVRAFLRVEKVGPHDILLLRVPIDSTPEQDLELASFAARVSEAAGGRTVFCLRDGTDLRKLTDGDKQVLRKQLNEIDNVTAGMVLPAEVAPQVRYAREPFIPSDQQPEPIVVFGTREMRERERRG